MEVLLGLAMEVVAAGIRRAARRPRPIVRVRPTYWLSAGVVALAVQAFVLAWLTWLIGRAFLTVWSDDLLIFLWIIVGPIALFGAAICLAAIGWLVGVARRTLAFDALARIELGVAGVAGLVTGGYALASVWSRWALLVSAASAVAVFVAALPHAWREAHVEYPFIA